MDISKHRDHLFTYLRFSCTYFSWITYFTLFTYSQLFTNLFLNQIDKVTNFPVEILSGVHSKRKGSEGSHNNIDPKQLNGVGAVEGVTLCHMIFFSVTSLFYLTFS